MNVLHEISLLKEQVYDKCSFNMTSPQLEKESKEYNACTFEINEQTVVFRTAKVTPTKTGQFVTLWKRKPNGPIEPFHMDDPLDVVIIVTKTGNSSGQFIFPKAVLMSKGILSSDTKEGKRGFRVYPPWDETTSKQARNTQKWQLAYFLDTNPQKQIDVNRAKKLFVPV